MKNKFNFKDINISKLLFCISVGGFLSVWIMEIFRMKYLSFLKDNMYKLQQLEENGFLNITRAEINILAFSIICFICIPFFIQKMEHKTIKICITIGLLFLDFIFFLRSLVTEQIDLSLIILVTISCIFLIYLLLDLLSFLYSWIQVNDSSTTKVDVAKLTFIWAIIVFIIGFLR